MYTAPKSQKRYVLFIVRKDKFPTSVRTSSVRDCCRMTNGSTLWKQKVIISTLASRRFVCHLVEREENTASEHFAAISNVTTVRANVAVIMSSSDGVNFV